MAKKLIELNMNKVDQTKLEELMDGGVNFKLYGIKKMSNVILRLENGFDEREMKSRVYKENRVAAVGAGIFAVGVGLAVGACIAAHNAFTYDPDVEIAKGFLGEHVIVKFK